jgi:site-specific DNA recombinase
MQAFRPRLSITRAGTGSNAGFAEHTKDRAGSRRDSEALLAGKLFDDRGNRMSPSHATKRGRRYRYYVSQAILQGRKEDVGSVASVPAMELER